MISSQLQEKINKSYDILRLGYQISKRFYDKPLIVTQSGGKDSSVVAQLALECLKPEEFELFCSWTTVDAPMTCKFIKDEFKRYESMGVKTTIYHPHDADGNPITMWNLIPKKRMPPTRLVRYCCQVFKETTTPNRFIATGVRAEESTNRSHSDIYIYIEREAKTREGKESRLSLMSIPKKCSMKPCRLMASLMQKLWTAFL